MATVKAIILREAVGDYRKGDTILGDDLKSFLKTNPNPDYYYSIRLEVEQPQLAVDVQVPDAPAAPVGKNDKTKG